MTKKIQVSFSEKQYELLDYFKGEMGESSSDVVRNIVIAWLIEQDFIQPRTDISIILFFLN